MTEKEKEEKRAELEALIKDYENTRSILESYRDKISKTQEDMNLNALMPIKGYDLSGGWECWWGTNYSTAKEMNSAIEGSMAEFDTSVYDVLTGIQTAIDLLQEKIGELYEQLAAI